MQLIARRQLEGDTVMMMNKIWAACMAFILANICILFYVYGSATSGEEKVAAQQIARLISTYAEPESNPTFLVRAEDRCRFYGPSYCQIASAQRANALSLFTSPIVLTVKPTTEVFYNDYLAARARLIKATDDYATLLDSKPETRAYIVASSSFEKEAGMLIGNIVSNLYALQDSTLKEADHTGSWVFALGYLCNFVLFALVVYARRMNNQKRG